MVRKRTDCNRRVGQLPASRTSTNILHHLQRNGDLSSEVLVFATNPSTSVENFEAVYGDGSLRNIHKCTSKTCLLSKYSTQNSWKFTYIYQPYFNGNLPAFQLSSYRNKTYPLFGIYLVEVSKGNTRTIWEICSELAIQIAEDVTDQ